MIEVLGGGWVRFIFEQAVERPVHLVGDFNEWNEESHPMEHLENGTHQIILQLPPGEYEYKYKSGCTWFNDACAHRYTENCWGSENSVVSVPDEGCPTEATYKDGFARGGLASSAGKRPRATRSRVGPAA